MSLFISSTILHLEADGQAHRRQRATRPACGLAVLACETAVASDETAVAVEKW